MKWFALENIIPLEVGRSDIAFFRRSISTVSINKATVLD